MFKLTLSKSDTAVLKAFAISIVIAHNFFWHLPNSPKFNEMEFYREGFWQFINLVIKFPLDFFHPTIVFFGHYGVHIFIFLSGYGLTKKFLQHFDNSTNGMRNFMGGAYLLVIYQIIKIIKLASVGFIVLLISRYFVYDIEPNVDVFTDFLKFLTFSQNFRSWQLFSFVAPWWFLALIVQLYLLFPLVFTICKKRPVLTLVLSFLCLALTGYLNHKFVQEGIFLFSTPLGQLAVFTLGIYLALGNGLDRKIVTFLCMLLPLTLTWKYAFPLSYVSVVISVLVLFQKWEAYLGKFKLIFIQIGSLSMFLYIVHPEWRWAILQFVRSQNSEYLTYIAFFGYVVFVFIFSLIVQKITAKLSLF